ncbi:MAG: NAD(P)-binding domain-containing protein [Coriobacteriia bacterium]|nr:NAD(P)-binding domain-containing protein [Coriobacteriia bacterium]
MANKNSNQLRYNKRAVVFVATLAAVVIAIILFTVISSLTPEAKMKRAISGEIGRSDFSIGEVVIQDQDWLLVRTSSEDAYLNIAYSALKKSGGSYELVLGPIIDTQGMTAEDFFLLGMPDSFIKYFFGDGTHFEFNELRERHNPGWISAVEAAIELYARKEGVKPWRVSLVKDSYGFDNRSDDTLTPYSRTSSFKVAFDENKTKLSVKTTEDLKMSIKLFDESGREVFSAGGFNHFDRFLPLRANLPEGYAAVNPTGMMTLVDENTPDLTRTNLPPLKAGDVVSLHYACPKTNLNPEDICRVYRYDYYY